MGGDVADQDAVALECPPVGGRPAGCQALFAQGRAQRSGRVFVGAPVFRELDAVDARRESRDQVSVADVVGDGLGHAQ